MTQNKIKGLLGLCRAAGKVSLGHDACESSMKSGGASLCLVSSDASERLKTEMQRTSEMENIPLAFLPLTMEETAMCMGTKKTAVLSVNDSGFAERLQELIGRETDI